MQAFSLPEITLLLEDGAETTFEEHRDSNPSEVKAAMLHLFWIGPGHPT
jgi:hypothetical protein